MTNEREAVMRAAEAYDEIHVRLGKLQQQLDESLAHQKAQEQLVAELRIELAQLRTTNSTYQAEAEAARTHAAAWRTFFATIQTMFAGFDIPTEDLPVKANGGVKEEEPVETHEPEVFLTEPVELVR